MAGENCNMNDNDFSDPDGYVYNYVGYRKERRGELLKRYGDYSGYERLDFLKELYKL